MRSKELIKHWQTHAAMPVSNERFSIRLPVHAAAQIMALCELFPGRSQDQLISDLLAAALEDVHENMPYMKGHEVVALDELGDPIYNDAGLSPRFHALTESYAARLKQNTAAH